MAASIYMFAAIIIYISKIKAGIMKAITLSERDTVILKRKDNRRRFMCKWVVTCHDICIECAASGKQFYMDYDYAVSEWDKLTRDNVKHRINLIKLEDIDEGDAVVLLTKPPEKIPGIKQCKKTMCEWAVACPIDKNGEKIPCSDCLANNYDNIKYTYEDAVAMWNIP